MSTQHLLYSRSLLMMQLLLSMDGNSTLAILGLSRVVSLLLLLLPPAAQQSFAPLRAAGSGEGILAEAIAPLLLLLLLIPPPSSAAVPPGGPSVSSVPAVPDGSTTSARFQWPLLVRGRALIYVHLETLVKEVLKDGAKLLLLLDLGLAVRRNQVERTERILVKGSFCSLLTFGPYCFRVTTSGAIQYGVPTIVVRFDCSGEIWAQKPKSVSFTLPSSPSSMLSLLMSRWITWLLCRNSSACSTSRQTAAIWPSSIHVSVTTSVSDPPGRYSITTHSSSDTR
uniref:Uncharacterized protein n=1 Tax=Anopheles arabiensis TaxID=7173 RepID=A0A182IG14_ANOAR